MPDPWLKFLSWPRSLLMLNRWRRLAHHLHRRALGGRALWLNIRNSGRTCRLPWRPWRLAPSLARLSS
eukprot:2858520-Pleurochrysis_carterae.AAC.2